MPDFRYSKIAIIAVAALLLLSIGSKAQITNLPSPIPNYFLYSNLVDVGQTVQFVTIIPAPQANAPYAFPLTYNVYQVGKIGNDLVKGETLENSLVVSSSYFASTVKNSNSVMNQTFVAPLAIGGSAGSNYTCYRVTIADSMGNTVNVPTDECDVLTIFRYPTASISPLSQDVASGNYIQLNLTYSGGYRGAGQIADYHIEWFNDTSGTPVLMPQFSGSTQTPGPGVGYNTSVLTLNETAGATGGIFTYYANIIDANGGMGTSNSVTVDVASANTYNVLTIKLAPSSSTTITTGESETFRAQAFFSSGSPMAGFTSYKWYINGNFIANHTYNFSSDTYNDTDNFTFYGNSSTYTGSGAKDNITAWIDIGPPGFFIDSATNATSVSVVSAVINGTTTIATTTISGGGSTITTTVPATSSNQGNFTVVLSDNLGSTASSTFPIFTTEVRSGPSVKSSLVFYQNQLPAKVSIPSGDQLNFSFACNIRIGYYTYYYGSDVYGLGVVPCGKDYSADSATSFEVLYSNSTNGIAIKSGTSTNTIATLAPQKVIHANLSSGQPTRVNLSQYGVNMTVKTSLAHEPVDIVVLNQSLLISPPNYQKIFYFYLNSSSKQNATVNVTLNYNCMTQQGPSGVFVLQNSTWVSLKNGTMVSSSGCVVSFDTYPSQSVMGIFAKTPTQPATVANSTSIGASSGSPSIQTPDTTYIIIAVAAVVVIAGIAYWVSGRRHALPQSPPPATPPTG